MPWFRSKSIDTFCPLGPYLIPADEIPDPHKLSISLKVNGEVRQKAKTSAMIFKIPEIISFISRFMTLNSGDIIATGTPEGVSPIKNGDVIEISITGLGTLHNTVLKAL
jgi:2-keto-4-pentenoate hydratase/2-oxohepta-3-ene-1,7-dioic acid hydratase in catechol pathway